MSENGTPFLNSIKTDNVASPKLTGGEVTPSCYDMGGDGGMPVTGEPRVQSVIDDQDGEEFVDSLHADDTQTPKLTGGEVVPMVPNVAGEIGAVTADVFGNEISNQKRWGGIQ